VWDEEILFNASLFRRPLDDDPAVLFPCHLLGNAIRNERKGESPLPILFVNQQEKEEERDTQPSNLAEEIGDDHVVAAAAPAAA
jgi:hypothetical protein